VSTDVGIRLEPTGSGARCRTILATLPTWFGFAEVNEEYARTADVTPTVVADVDGEDVGLLTLVTHTPYAAEVHLMAVRPEQHRCGIGRRLLHFAEEHLVASGVEYLQVKTLSDRHPDEGYVLTRAFYRSVGFRPLEEMPTLWSEDQPALLLVKRL
jgi:GNAT superfamily N-acetyltransferase